MASSIRCAADQQVRSAGQDFIEGIDPDGDTGGLRHGRERPPLCCGASLTSIAESAGSMHAKVQLSCSAHQAPQCGGHCAMRERQGTQVADIKQAIEVAKEVE
jgi:hypothetical protein